MRPIQLVPGALADLQRAFGWYEDQRLGLGKDFLRSLQRTLERLSLYPDSGVKGRTGFRQALMPRFPYLVIYEADSNALTVIAIFHTKRDLDGLTVHEG